MTPTQNPQERSLTEQEQRDWQGCSDHAFEHLPLGDRKQSPLQLVTEIERCVEDWQEGRRPKESDLVDTALSLGKVWGDQLVREFGWEWVVVRDGGNDHYAVTIQDRSFVIYPAFYIKCCLEDARIDCMVLLSFNMMREGKINGVPAGTCFDVMPSIQRIVPKNGRSRIAPRPRPSEPLPEAEPVIFERVVLPKNAPKTGPDAFRRADFDTRNPEAPDEYDFDYVHLRGLKQMRVHLRHQKYDSYDEDTIDLFPRGVKELKEDARISIRIYDPRTAKRFGYITPRRGFKLKGGKKFDGTLLALEQVAAGYKHDFYGSVSGKGRALVHIYTSEQRVVEITYKLGSLEFETCALFQHFARETVLSAP